MKQRNDLTALQALYCMAARDQAADQGKLGRALGLSRSDTARMLDELDRQGLVDAARVRLTMSGLVLAVASLRQRRQRRAFDEQVRQAA